jgi:hypothetical protein
MSHKRKAYTPFSTSSEAGVTTAPVEGYINVDQEIKPTVDTGFIDSKGIWIGNVTNDSQFILYTDEAIADGGTILTPTANPDGTWPLDMTGYRDLFIAIKPTNGGNCTITAAMGPDSNSFANLSPIIAATSLLGNMPQEVPSDLAVLFSATHGLTADFWNIFIIGDQLRNQKLLQFKIVNNSGGISTIDTAFMRLV